MMLNVIYGSIFILIVIIIYGAWSRKRLYKEVDRLENKKIELLNEPVTEELSKIKGLKMSGETEEQFEHWRERWDSIITIQFPEIEEKLFDIEELANKYRFQKAKRHVVIVDDELNTIQTQMKQIIDEVNKLIHSEERNRQDIHEVRDLFDETKKKLWVQKGTLSHAVPIIEQKLKDVQEMFETFESETLEGNYFHAREILLEMTSLLSKYRDFIDKVPQYLVKVEKEIPKQLDDLEMGLNEMEADGYALHHFSYQWQIKEMKRRLLVLLPLIEHLRLEEAEKPVESIEKEINDIYEKLEYEVLSRNYVEKGLPELKERLIELPHQFKKLMDETVSLKLNYHLTEEHDKEQLKIEKHIKELYNQYAVIEDAIEEKKQSFSTLRKMTHDFRINLDKAEERMKESKESLSHLRSDERKAEETIKNLKNSLLLGQKKLRRSNIPGIPEHLIYLLEESEVRLFEAKEGLNQTPISIQEVNERVAEAKRHVDDCNDKLNETIEHASLSERVIQYGNRYRSSNDHLNIKLLQAEDRFRNYLYEEALELALEGVEPVDPDVLEKVMDQEPLDISYS